MLRSDFDEKIEMFFEGFLNEKKFVFPVKRAILPCKIEYGGRHCKSFIDAYLSGYDCDTFIVEYNACFTKERQPVYMKQCTLFVCRDGKRTKYHLGQCLIDSVDLRIVSLVCFNYNG